VADRAIYKYIDSQFCNQPGFQIIKKQIKLFNFWADILAIKSQYVKNICHFNGEGV